MASLERWTAAVESHTPGARDAAVTSVASMSPARRSTFLRAAQPFVIYLRRITETPSPPGLRLSKAELEAVRKLADEALGKQSFAAWLHRAIMLETDVAILAPELTSDAMRDARGTGLAEAIHAEDGELGARNQLNWHWQFARDLVSLRDPARSDLFAADWYHAVALYHLDNLFLAEMSPHVLKGFQAFPHDPRLLFDNACMADAFGSARVQAVLVSEQPRNFRPSIPSAESAATQATREFARVVELDPGFFEARVRLARLIEAAGKPADALTLLTPVFGKPVSPSLEYMAHLIAGRAQFALGETQASVEHLNAALQLFPAAQAPVIALSLVALESGDLAGSVELAARLNTGGDVALRIDPWWFYFQAPWLNQSGLLDRLRDEVRR